ncbi:patatin-like phospholipase family protein [Prauserella shujinwangii]|uniref:patatin-like phospholipase family protein n=1 Tax=Prauserella shujinwangii TaxID=1453103 RepID=UPI0011B1FF83|nr:patatin-like phospholipase family protein [Prauserella shujinwangii]
MSTPSPAPSRSAALALAVATVALPAAGLAAYAALTPGVHLAAVALRGAGQPLPPGTAAAVRWDFLLLVLSGAGLWCGITAARWAAATPRALELARFARTALVIAVAADVVENAALLAALRWPRAPWLLDATAAAATVRFCALLPAAVVAACGAVTLARRSVLHSARRVADRAAIPVETVPPRPIEDGDPPVPAEPGDGSDNNDTPPAGATRWRNAYTVPGVSAADVRRRWDRGEHTTGFCLSGGGIRSASVAMGALQSLRDELLDARYLVSVSGGGFTAGALQQALTGARPATLPGEVLRDPRSAFREGTTELHHVQRHSSYLADTPARLLAALGRVALGLLLSLTVLFGPAVALGVAAGLLYRWVPLGGPVTGGPFPVPGTGGLAALGALGAAAFLLALFARGAADRRRGPGRLARRLVVLTVVAVVLTIAIPSLVWLVEWVLARTGRSVAIAGPAGTVMLTFLATIASMVWRHRATLRQRLSGMLRPGQGGGPPAALPNGVLQRLLVIATLGVLAAGWLAVFAAAAATGGGPGALTAGAVAAAVVLVLGAAFDVTSLSLHPFYRQRIASAFAVRAVRRDGDGQVVAVPYEAAERTTLSGYGGIPDGTRFPEVVFAAAANLTGESRTAPGLGAVSYTLGADWTGGPDVGWVRTEDLERIVPPRFRRDLTVQGAVAVSGAAFASAMGRSSRWYQVLLAVSGARLGAWLPNPGFVRRAHEAAAAGRWTHPWLPRARRLPYLLREVFGSHPHRDALLHVTDGGHYDNLGLVELFRRRCTRIFCVDATADPPPSGSALAEALTLAWQELGVRVELDQPWQGTPGEGPWDGDPRLAARLSESPVLTGTVHYPPESGLGSGVRGRLVVVKALLWRELPYPLLSYAARHPEFPHDSTGDQWFDHEKFAAYTELGRHLGAAAARAAQPVEVPLPAGEHTPEVLLTTEPGGGGQ